MTTLNSRIPEGPIKDKWTLYKDHIDLVNPANKRNIDIIVVGTGLAGGSAAATLAELGYNVKAFAYQDSPRRAHSIAAQGGINAAKNYMGDGDSNYRLFYDTVKGGDYRSREANVYRLAEVSGAYYRPMCGARRTFCKRLWWIIRQPFIWWCIGFKNFLCKRTNRTTIIVRSLFSNEPSNSSWKN